jgi:glycosyltransferase involved in cell wall biosynthesis
MGKTDVIIEMEKLHNPNSGLGQFCLHLGNAMLDEKEKPTIKFFVPANKKDIFGEKNCLKKKWNHRYFGVNADCKIWHQAHQTSVYLPKDKRTKVILTVHDLNFLDKYEGKKLERHRRILQNNIDRADVITVISDYTNGVLQGNADTGNKKIVKIYNGNTLKKFEGVSCPRFMTEGNFIFSIGIFSAKKNFEVLIPFIKQLGNLNLVIAGNHETPYGKKIKDMIRSYGVAGNVILPGEISEEEKFWLYRNCSAFVFPSLSEGFGLPVIEAMSLGKPTFISDKSSLPEVGGSEAFYFKSFDPSLMANEYRTRMNEFVFDIAKATRIIQHSEKFTWKFAAKEYIRLYESML